jgi:putative transposase
LVFRDFWHLQGIEIVKSLRCRLRRNSNFATEPVVITLAGKKHWLWRAGDQEGFVLDVLVQSRRDKKAANACSASS